MVDVPRGGGRHHPSHSCREQLGSQTDADGVLRPICLFDSCWRVSDPIRRHLPERIPHLSGGEASPILVRGDLGDPASPTPFRVADHNAYLLALRGLNIRCVRIQGRPHRPRGDRLRQREGLRDGRLRDGEAAVRGRRVEGMFQGVPSFLNCLPRVRRSLH